MNLKEWALNTEQDSKIDLISLADFLSQRDTLWIGFQAALKITGNFNLTGGPLSAMGWQKNVIKVLLSPPLLYVYNRLVYFLFI